MVRSIKVADWSSATTVRELVEHHLPAECRDRETWRYVVGALNEAAHGGDINDVVISLRIVLQLEQVPCLPK